MIKTTTKMALLGSAFCFATGAYAAGPNFSSDVYIDGSLCVGDDCVFGSAFGFDTIRLQENNLRIRFQDTSSSGSFPTVDWQIIINGTQNGDPNFFGIEDVDNSTTPFRVDSGSINNALRIDSEGDIGIGTATPIVELHAVDGNTPGLRLEQNQSNGFTAQTWDLAGNEVNFFLRDVTHGSRLPFRVKPGAPNNSVYIWQDGKVGMGTLDGGPNADLHVRRPGQSFATFRLEAPSASPNTTGDITFTDAGAEGQFRFNIGDADGHEMSLDHNGVLELISSQSFNFLRISANGASPNTAVDITYTDAGANGELRYNIVDGDGQEMSLDADGNMEIAGSLTTVGPVCATGCDRVFDADYALLSIDEHADLMWTKGHLPAVGPTLPGQPFNMTDKMGDMLNELEHAHIYIAQQQKIIESMSERLTALEAKLED